MIRVRSPRGQCDTNTTRCFVVKPIVISRFSSSEWSASGKVIAKESRNTVAASSKETPCLRKLAFAFFGSHSWITGATYHAQVEKPNAMAEQPRSASLASASEVLRPDVKVLGVAGFPGTVYFISFSYPSASHLSCVADSYRLTVLTDRENQRLLKAVPCANAVHSWYCQGHQHPLDTLASHSPIQRDSAP